VVHANRNRALAWLERLLLVVGVCSLGYYGYRTVEARQFQQEQTAALEALLHSRDAMPAVAAPMERTADAASSSDTLAPTAALPVTRSPLSRDLERVHGVPGAFALLDIPRLKISTPVLSGDDQATLDLGVGHLPETPRPWESGNSAFAAHRDGLFRPLKNIRIGDEIRVRSTHGSFTYRVTHTRIVKPDDVSVLDPTDADTLTLITCYPFTYVGHAPRRFIVTATKMERRRN
jgi:sortase A